MSCRQIIRAGLTWIDGAFVSNASVIVGADGAIEDVVVGEVLFDKDCSTVIKDLPDEAMIPGLVNCHSHAFQRGLRGLGEVYPLIESASAGKEAKNNDSFWTWRDEMYKLVGRITKDEFYVLARSCFDEMRSSGITSVGEFHYFHHLSASKCDFELDEVVIRAAKDVGVRLVLLNAFYSRGGFDDSPLSASQSRFRTPSIEEYMAQMDALAARVANEPHITLGVVAHSLRAVNIKDFKKLRMFSVDRGLVFHLHIEEQPKEVEACQAAHEGKTPMDLVLDNVQVDSTFTAVHCNHTDSKLLSRFTSMGGIVCICPLTEGSLGDGVIQVPSACSGSICIGTDCNARIDVFEELRWLEYSQRLHKLRRGMAVENSPACSSQKDCAKELFRYATEVGADSLGLRVGRIAKGYLADFATIDMHSLALRGLCNAAITSGGASLLSAIIFGGSAESMIKQTCVGGAWKSWTRACRDIVPPDGNAKRLKVK